MIRVRYLPLLPQVASGVLTPQSIAVSLRRSRRYRTRIIPGGAAQQSRGR